MAFTKKKRRSRSETAEKLRSLERKRGAAPRALSGAKRARPWLLALLLAGLSLWLFPPYETVRSLSLLREGEISKEDVLAPFTFPILKEEAALRAERDRAEQAVLPIVDYREQRTQDLQAEVDAFFRYFDKEREKARVARASGAAPERSAPPTAEGEAAPSEGAPAETSPAGGAPAETAGEGEASKTPEARERDWAARVYGLTPLARAVLMDPARGKLLEDVFRSIVVERVAKSGVIRSRDPLVEEGAQAVTLRDAEGHPRTLSLADLDDLDSFRDRMRRWSEETFAQGPELAATFQELVQALVTPNLVHDPEETRELRAQARAAVPPTVGEVLEGERIVGRHVRVTDRHVQILRSLAEAQREREGARKIQHKLLRYLGQLAIAGLLLALGWLLLLRHRPDVARSHLRLLLLSLLSAVTLVSTALLSRHWELSAWLVPVCLGPALATILLDAVVGLVLGVVLALWTGIVTGFPGSYVLVSVLAVAAAVRSADRVRNRNDFYRAMLLLAVVYAAAVGAVQIMLLPGSRESLFQMGWGAVNGVFSFGAAMVLLPIFEGAFKITTNLTRLELSDLNRPLLKRLALEAPGTYTHSILVGNLAEAACEAIGANSLRARVACYYHDIGKMTKPEYFVENQLGAENPHDSLSPKLSSLILASHVKEGAEMAEEEGLPREIIDVIKEHHGDTLMSYFYQKAVDQDGEENVSKEDFLYPGPRPSTKESAVIMLADSCEAATRAIDDPSPAKIDGRVRDVFNLKVREGQFENAPITFREIERVRESFVRTLAGMRHRRVKYPDEEKRGGDTSVPRTVGSAGDGARAGRGPRPGAVVGGAGREGAPVRKAGTA